MSFSSRLDRAVASLPQLYPGPGGAAAVIRAGEVLVRHAWGWANAERRIPFTPSTLFRMCSVTKQFTCAVTLDIFPDPSELDSDVRQSLPLLRQPAPTTLHLCHNQSGLRDYWAVAMLHGAPAVSPFGDAEAGRVIGGARTLQFEPGARYSYANQNFRLLSDILQQRTGRSFAELLRQRIFEPAGMETALLAADTSALPDRTQGYEGSQASGFRVAENRILWTGDAGLGASLDDMIAWERYIDAGREGSSGLYSRLSVPVHFADGALASYGFGLTRSTEFGRYVIGHGGALRGWRSNRLYVPDERISVVIMFNHLADAREAALDMLAGALGEEPPKPPPVEPDSELCGAYIDQETGLAARIDPVGTRLRLRFGQHAEMLALGGDGSASGSGQTRLTPRDAGIWMDRPQENQSSLLKPCTGAPGLDVSGRYRCEELDTELSVEDAGGALYGAFSGFLGPGRMELLDPIGPDVWALPCPRALDHTPPGDWTLRFRRDEAGKVDAVQVGCWLARQLDYTRLS